MKMQSLCVPLLSHWKVNLKETQLPPHMEQQLR